MTYEDLKTFIHELFTVPGCSVPPELTDKEEQDLRRVLDQVTLEDLEVLRRYRRQSPGSIDRHQRAVGHTSRRDLYVKNFGGELVKARKHFGLLPPDPSPLATHTQPGAR